MPYLEIIAMTLEDALEAQAGGATSLELVDNLALGGLTPPLDVVQAIRDKISLHLRAMVRPHANSFVYSAHDVEQMLAAIEAFKRMGVNGIVFGALHPDRGVDLALTAQIALAATPLELTFHRAIDESRDAHEAIPALKGIAQRILTSGLKPTVWEGRATIRGWIEQYGHAIRFACGGGLRIENLAETVQAIGAPEYHFGTAAQTNHVVDSAKVRQILEIINAA